MSIFLLNSALSVASKMAEAVSNNEKTSFIINPVVGVCLKLPSNKVHNIWVGFFQPEQITGSSRMKSGSTTKILLETTFYIALNSILISKVQKLYVATIAMVMCNICIIYGIVYALYIA